MDLQHLRASDGTGEAILAHVQSVRTIGSTVLDLDNIDNWNSKCVVVTGTPNANGFIDSSGMTVMYGHTLAGDFIIDGYAPGYTDQGNTTTQVAIIKMTTSWADALVDLLGVHLQDDGKLKVTSLDDFYKPADNNGSWVVSGGIVAQSAGLVGTFSNIVFYYLGLRYTKSSVSNKTYTASKDTYVDIASDGTVYYSEVANGAAAPALTTGRLRIAKVVTNGSAITSVTQSGIDSLGHAIYNVSSQYIEKYFTTAGANTWTKPEGLKYIIVDVVGGGGGGAGTTATNASQHSVGSGGGGGGLARKRIPAYLLGATETATVGAGGGISTAGANGNNGTNSTFGSHCTGGGGSGGVTSGAAAATGGIFVAGGSGGTGTGGDLNIAGQNGGTTTSVSTSINVCKSGFGGASPLGYGYGGNEAQANGGGASGKSYGGGGSGAASSVSNSAQSGQAGAAGIIVVREYY